MPPRSKKAEAAIPAGAARPDVDQKSYLEHLKKINDVFYDQIKIADQKAAYIFTIMVAFMITSADGRGVFRFDRYFGGDPLLMAVSAVLALAFIVSLCSAILVVLPRRLKSSTSLFWGGWIVHRAAFMEAAKHGDPDYLMREYLGNIDNLALIAASKYRYVGLSFRALLVAVVAYAALLGVGASV